MSVRSLLLGAAALVALAPAASASEYAGWYISGGGGANIHEEEELQFSTGVEGQQDFETGWVGLGALGYKHNGLRIELELAYRTNDMDDTFHQNPASTFAVDGDVTIFSQMVNLGFDIGLTDSMDLVLGIGIGGASVDTEMNFPGFPNTYDGDEYLFAYQAMAGLNVDLTDQLQLFGEYRYFATAQYDLPDQGVPGLYLNDWEPINHSGIIGLRYFFVPVAAPVMVETPAAPPAEPAMAKTYIVFFDFNKSNLTAEAQAVVAEASEAFKAGANVVLVVGHTDTVGSAGYNQKLSERRAASVKAEMVRLGVPSDVITTEGRGFSEPLVPTGPGVKEPQNRRAVIELQ